MRNDLNNFNGLALGIMIVVFIIAMAFVGTSLVEQEKAVTKQYYNKAHENFCIIATDRGASDEYLLSNDC